jgi:hypothetical protein
METMLAEMDERITLAEQAMDEIDAPGDEDEAQLAPDPKNFAVLQKQYESIRAELVTTLNH